MATIFNREKNKRHFLNVFSAVVVSSLFAYTEANAQTILNPEASAGASNANIFNTTTPNRQTVVTAPPVQAPGLAAAGIEVCLGSSSAGISVLGGGFSLGSTTKDDDCNIRLYARQLHAMGLKNAAIILQCLNPQVNYAMAAAGTPCPVPPQSSGFVRNWSGTLPAYAAAGAPTSAAAVSLPPAAAPVNAGMASEFGGRSALERAGCIVQTDDAGPYLACPVGVLP